MIYVHGDNKSIFKSADEEEDHMSNSPTEMGQNLQNLMNESLGSVSYSGMSTYVKDELKHPQHINQRTFNGKNYRWVISNKNEDKP